MKSGQVFDFRSGEVVRESFENGIFVTLFSEGGPAVALYVQVASPAARALDATIKDLCAKAKAAGVGSSQRMKAVGDAQLVDKLEPIARALKISLERKIAVTGKIEIEFYPKSARFRYSKVEASIFKNANLAQGHPPAKSGAVVALRPPKSGKIRVLIVDDSTTIQNLLSKILTSDPQIEIAGVCGQPLLVPDLVARIKPDVITMDIHMPEMDGVTLVKKLMLTHPIPTVMISSMSIAEGPQVLHALEYGAVDYIQKPSFNDLHVVSPLIIEKVKSAVGAKIKIAGEDSSVRVVKSQQIDANRVIAIGSSTGGTEALREILTQMPADIPPIVIVQHIPAVFSRAFAERLDKLCPFDVKEAAEGDDVIRGRVLIAPGGVHMTIAREGMRLVVRLDPPGLPEHRHKPAVDILFRSVANTVGAAAVGVVLTGMGSDGAAGLKQMHDKGSSTIVQDEATCVVFGMPREAIKAGGVDKVLPLGKIAEEIFDQIQSKKNLKAAK